MSTGPLDLLGDWSMQRSIEDRRAGEMLAVTGTLQLLAEDDDRIGWHESGTLSRPGRAGLPVTRTLAVVRRGGGEDWWVVFDHGGDFHPWSPGEWVDHPCGADHYRGLVDLADLATLPAAWTISWVVSGPAKDYTMTSTLTRRTTRPTAGRAASPRRTSSRPGDLPRSAGGEARP